MKKMHITRHILIALESSEVIWRNFPWRVVTQKTPSRSDSPSSMPDAGKRLGEAKIRRLGDRQVDQTWRPALTSADRSVKHAAALKTQE
ncbi:hypothetical protein [Hydrogenophaga sp.]|uniref:hypothetical protein n=1 Tax=Hydrogenophaga sp. TaxID=1904254 RepID=UPI002716A049|nr:hypothetical protein [Hydrogenophaga sp.]MDO8904298.1 hypothetical protein [Hydrogenophaga sp.]